MSPTRGSISRALCGACLFGLVSCGPDPMVEVREQYATGRYGAAWDRLTDLQRGAGGDIHRWQLERGIVGLALRSPEKAVGDLKAGRDRLDEVRGTDYLGWVKAMLLDDRQLPYQGADYEQVVVRALLAVAELVRGDFNDAVAYALQVLDKQEEIIESFRTREGELPKSAYKLVGFGSYIAGILYEERLEFDRARRYFERVKEVEPGFPQVEEDIRRATEGHHSAKGNGVVWVIGLVGRGPFRIELDEPVSRASLAVAQTIWAIVRGRATIPNIAEVKIPGIAIHKDNPTEVHVETDGRAVGATATVTNVNEAAVKEFRAMRSHIVARAVVRRAFKIVTTEAVKEVVNRRGHHYSTEEALIDLAISGLGLLWTGVERADLRCWSLVPARLTALRVELPAGEHDLVFRAGRGGRPTGAPQGCRVLVRDGFNTYVVVLVPTWHGGPEPMTSAPAEPGAEELEGADPDPRPEDASEGPRPRGPSRPPGTVS